MVGFELMISWLLVSSFNHLTWDTARNKSYISQNLVEIIPEVLLSIWRPCVQCLPIKFTKEKRLLQFWLSVLSKFESILASLFCLPSTYLPLHRAITNLLFWKSNKQGCSERPMRRHHEAVNKCSIRGIYDWKRDFSHHVMVLGIRSTCFQSLQRCSLKVGSEQLSMFGINMLLP